MCKQVQYYKGRQWGEKGEQSMFRGNSIKYSSMANSDVMLINYTHQGAQLPKYSGAPLLMSLHEESE